MNSPVKIYEPYDYDTFANLRCGDIVEISGTVYTARDAAHARIKTALDNNEELPFPLMQSIIYYAGPSPAKPGQVIGSCGPTTAGRMDIYTPELISAGLIGMIGKGPRSREVIEAIKSYGALYFAAVGGAAALTASCITSSEVVAYSDLGPEAVRKLNLKNYPCVVAIDTRGTSIYELGPKKYSQL